MQMNSCRPQNVFTAGRPLSTSRAALCRSAARLSRGALRVEANWNQTVAFTGVKVVTNKPEATGLYALTVDVGDLAKGYTKPGQYIQLKVGDSKPGFFAIASAPSSSSNGTLQLLIKSAPGSTAELLCGLASGETVEASPVMGKGFSLEKLSAGDVSDVLLFATGSGISPLRAVIESGALEGRSSTLFWGTKELATTPYSELLPKWAAAKVSIIQVYSGKGEGYIQDTLARDLSKVVTKPGSTGALLCGHKGMVQAVTAQLTEAGVAAERILLNF